MTIIKILVPRIVVAVLAGAALNRFCIEPYQGNLTVMTVYLRTSEMEKRDPEIEVAIAHRNLRDLEDVETSRRLDPQWYLLYGANWESLGEWNRAADAYTRALRIDERPEIYFRRGFVTMQMGRIDDALPDLVRAVRFDPRFAAQLDPLLRKRVKLAIRQRP